MLKNIKILALLTIFLPFLNSCGTGVDAKQFPPEPFRWIGAIIIRNAVRRKEKAEQYDRNPNWIDQQLAKLATSIGRVDRIKD